MLSTSRNALVRVVSRQPSLVWGLASPKQPLHGAVAVRQFTPFAKQQHLISNNNNNNNNLVEWQQPHQRRGVHSRRQILRLFKNPNKLYRDAKLGIDRSPKPPPELTYLPVYTPDKILPNGWSAPPPPSFQRPDYPFTILRTSNKPKNAAGFLPIYTKTRYVGCKQSLLRNGIASKTSENGTLTLSGFY